MIQICRRSIIMTVVLAFYAAISLVAQEANPQRAVSNKPSAEELKFVVIISRHGVRSPTAKTNLLNTYSRQPWPAWSVPPGYLTEHGARLMTFMGAYDRELFASQGLLTSNVCSDAAHIRIIADSDQRTRETGKALAAGLAPGCKLEVVSQSEGTADPLFHSLAAGVGKPDRALAVQAVAGRIGAYPQGVTEAYRPQLEALEKILLACPSGAVCGNPPPASLFDIAASIAPGGGDHLVEMRTPLSLASTMTENLLLEYTEGMDRANVGWGQVSLDKLRGVLQLHTASEDIFQRTSYIARAQASNLLSHVARSMEQAVAGQTVSGSLSKSEDRLLVLVGHDTNLANIAGAMNLSWLIDGRRDDTPPGGALVFELWKQGGEYFVRTFYVAQTADQMRNTTPLNLQSPPERVPVFVPGCGRADGSCAWKSFQQTLNTSIDTSFVK
jgi:4-phytase / acid phosphatase